MKDQFMNKLIAAAAREQGGVVDLAGAKSTAHIAIMLKAIEEVRGAFALGLDADIGEQALRHLEEQLNWEIFQRTAAGLDDPLEDRMARAAHRAMD